MAANKKTVLITGATGVIGVCLVKYFFGAGYSLILTGRSKDKLHRLAEDMGSDVLVFPADVGNTKDIKKLFQFIQKNTDTLDVVIPAAGIYGEIGLLGECDEKKWEDAFRVNVFGAMAVVKYALPYLKKSAAGNIIFFAGGGEGALSHFSSYAASKGAILRLSETLAQELKTDGIRVNAIAPGLINSGFVQEIIKSGPDKAGVSAYQSAENQLSGKEETVAPDKAAELCLFLASDKAAGLTGKIFAARYDDLGKIEKHKEEIINSDIYTSRRLKPKHLGYEW